MTTDHPVRVGVVGCGMIGPAYLQAMQGYDVLEVVACADLEPAKAEGLARQSGRARACSPEELIGAGDVELVLNLTPPEAHAAVNLAAIAAGKHVYCEKPLAMTLEDASATLTAAAEAKVLLGCAPDTFLGAALQSARKLIDEGAIGTPVSAGAFMLEWGPENWHPDPRFHYRQGGGPLLGMGPYYITALVSLLGPARRVCGSTLTLPGERTVRSEPLRGTKIKPDVATHVAGTVDFACGAIASVVTSWEAACGNTLPYLEVYGTEATLNLPDPDKHDGAVKLRRCGGERWQRIQPAHDVGARRGVGVADAAYAVRGSRPQRATGELALHVLDVLFAFERSSATGKHVTLASTCERPASLPAGLGHRP